MIAGEGWGGIYGDPTQLNSENLASAPDQKR